MSLTCWASVHLTLQTPFVKVDVKLKALGDETGIYPAICHPNENTNTLQTILDRDNIYQHTATPLECEVLEMVLIYFPFHKLREITVDTRVYSNEKGNVALHFVWRQLNVTRFSAFLAFCLGLYMNLFHQQKQISQSIFY